MWWWWWRRRRRRRRWWWWRWRWRRGERRLLLHRQGLPRQWQLHVAQLGRCGRRGEARGAPWVLQRVVGTDASRARQWTTRTAAAAPTQHVRRAVRARRDGHGGRSLRRRRARSRRRQHVEHADHRHGHPHTQGDVHRGELREDAATLGGAAGRHVLWGCDCDRDCGVGWLPVCCYCVLGWPVAASPSAAAATTPWTHQLALIRRLPY